MTLYLATTLICLGLIGGFFSGWLGIGGGIVMAPLLLYVPSAVGAGVLDMKTVAGLTMVQSLFATGSGAAVHRRFKYLNQSLVLWMGSGAAAASLAGAVFSRNLSSDILEGIFALLALAAAVLMLAPHREAVEEPTAASVDFNRGLALSCALAIGLVGGMVGQSGAFIFIPVMLYVLGIPTRTVIGSSLGIVFLAALAGSFGKIATGQVDYSMALFCVVGAVAGAQLGGALSIRTGRRRLRHILAVLIGVTAIRMAWDLAGA
ncbi:MAG: sulfite exporter TauE/SafE family protein [Actinobacteria bacterium]|nr:sulfite exporter TauE/SafE family protein [Actinomycetota bacterium]